MYQVNFKQLIIFIVVSMLLASNAYAENKDTLVIGMVSVGQSEADRAGLVSLAKDIVVELKSEGIEKVEVYLAKSVDEMIEAIKTGKVDWVSDSLFIALLLAENTRSDAFLSKSREVKRYNTIFFTRKNSEAKSIANISKKIMLFGDQTSTSRYFVPFYELTNHSYIPIVYGKTGDESGKKKNVFYKFEKDQNKLIREIMSNNLNIGVLNNKDYRMLPDSIKSDLKIIHETIAYPETLDLIRSDLNIDLKLKLKKLLLDSSKIKQKKSEETVGVLRFEKFAAEGRDGYVFLRGIIKHDVVPSNIKKTKKMKDLKELEDQKIYERIMAEP